jgi:hypothetical protein
MIRRPPFGDIVATATVAALTGTFILVVGIAIVSAASANDLQQLEIISIGFHFGHLGLGLGLLATLGSTSGLIGWRLVSRAGKFNPRDF